MITDLPTQPAIPQTTITNPWITPKDLNDTPALRNGVTVLRAFAGLNTNIGLPNVDGNSNVLNCTVSYHERELYPNGEVIKDELKTYTLQDLQETTGSDEQGNWRQEALAVLTGFIMQLGYNGIINPARDTLSNSIVLPLNVPNGYALRDKTRAKIYE
jgi:hypothetical protein